MGLIEFFLESWTRFAVGAAGVILLILFVIVFLIICAGSDKISITVAILKASSSYIEGNIRTILVPIFTFLICVLYVAYWVVVMAYLYTIGELREENEKVKFVLVAPIKHDK